MQRVKLHKRWMRLHLGLSEWVLVDDNHVAAIEPYYPAGVTVNPMAVVVMSNGDRYQTTQDFKDMIQTVEDVEWRGGTGLLSA